MTVTTTCLLLVFGAYALGNWWAVEVGNQRLEWLCKPAALVALTGAAMALRPDEFEVKVVFVIGLLLSLAGDVFLMLPSDRFLPGLISFFLAHVAYVVGFAIADPEPVLLLVGVLVVAAGMVFVGRPLVARVRSGDQSDMAVPVMAYMAVISLMVVFAIGNGNPFGIAGALLFYASDATLGWNRFVEPTSHGRLAVMATYHLGQLGLVLFLI
ncbi:MAG TPA: lysoplasmalogenase [Acidimicrobiales bacterium]|nr:lysoplasmalogenase [Acidimicrobiales bacterium]